MHERCLVVTGVVTQLGIHGVALPVDACTAEEVEIVGIETLMPVETGVTHHGVLLGGQ